MACFGDDADYLVYLAHLRALSRRHRCAIHAYCLMSNHVHLLLTPSDEEGCAALMRDLGQRYVQVFNKRHERTGTLWEGRFRSCIVESARYVLACYRYIELNPVRAGMVARPDDYGWSSYTTNAGMHRDPLVAPHPEFLALANASDARHTAYRSLLEQPYEATLLDAIRKATHSACPLASDEFKARFMAPLGYRIERGKPGPKRKADEEASSEQGQLGL